MKLIVVASGSKGNCYILRSSSGETLVIDAGAKADEMLEYIDFDLPSIVGLIVSHAHMDHAIWLDEYLVYSIPTWVNEHTQKAKKINRHNLKLMYSETQFTVGNFKITPLEVSHDVQCFSFLIDHPEMGTTYFITDSNFVEWDLSPFKINNWIVECNYVSEKLENNYQSGKLDKGQYDRIKNGHFGLHNCLDFFRSCNLSATNRVVLIHASKRNGNFALFEQMVSEVIGRPAVVAKKGMIIDKFNKRPFSSAR